MIRGLARLRFAIAAAAIALGATGAVRADDRVMPPVPGWQTDAAQCAWHWRQGGGWGLWAETCQLGGATWQVAWNADQAAFVTRRGALDQGIAVQPLVLPEGAGMAALRAQWIETGALSADADCDWQTIAPQDAPPGRRFHILAPRDRSALAPTAMGEVPAPACGPYGASTHGLRYIMTDSHWPERAVFVDEGQERPLFDPMSITPLP
ncbi:MAG: hypothetical protein RLZZ491_2058 [Pseudomonadota bacterium]